MYFIKILDFKVTSKDVGYYVKKQVVRILNENKDLRLPTEKELDYIKELANDYNILSIGKGIDRYYWFKELMEEESRYDNPYHLRLIKDI